MHRTMLVTLALLCGCGAAEDFADEDVDFATGAANEGPPNAPPPKPNSVAFARDLSERIYALRIRDDRHTHPKAIYSVRLANLSSQESLRLRAEVTLSRCNEKDIAGESGDAKVTPCDSKEMRQNPYGYNPRFSAAFVLADSPNSAGGKRVSNWVDTVCTEGEHHCALAVPEVNVQDLPDAAEKYVNLVVSADDNGNNAKDWHVMEVEQKHGSLSVTRVSGPGARVLERSSTTLRTTSQMTVDRPEEDGDPTQVRQLMYQVKLDGLQGGDVVDADARMRAINGSYSCDPLMTGELVLSPNPNTRKATGGFDEVLGAKNGRNCSNHSNKGCRYEKSGAVRLKKDTPSTMFLSYVVVAARSCAAANGSDKWHADPQDGFLKAGVRR